MHNTGVIGRCDLKLASLAREEGALRLRLGQLLEVMGRGPVFELGFSSLGAYAVERCERSVRWVEGARCLARRLEGLPELRRATALGEVSWTLAELLARVATPADEARWLGQAEGRTVRQVRELVAAAARTTAASEAAGRAVLLGARLGARAGAPAAANDAAAGDDPANDPANDPASCLADDPDDDSGERCTLTCTVDREDAWLFEATLHLLEYLGDRGLDAQVEAMLAEAQGTLLASLPSGAVNVAAEGDPGEARRRWASQLRRWQVEAEAACEEEILGHALAGSSAAAASSEAARAAALGMAPLEHAEHASCLMLDEQVRALSRAMARHELEVSQLALRFQRAGGWRRLGYATEAQYARERLGLSRSSFAARRALALRLEKLPGVAAALGSGKLGVEAALQLVRIATPNTEAAWVERARRRTIKHLREEVVAALTAVRIAGERDCPPPEDTEIAAFQGLERAVLSGRFAESGGTPAAPPGAASQGASAAPSVGPVSPSGEARPLVEPATEARSAWCTMLGSLAAWLSSGRQVPAAPGAPRGCRSAGRVTLRLRVSRELRLWWRSLEAQAQRWLPVGTGWLRFVCLSVWRAWRHVLGTEVAYGHIYARDRFRCMSPVCNRRDVTPHHLHFRSAGGSDDAHNIGSICTWCHLLGIHGGRIRASGTADHVRWELGPREAPCVIVHGRERQAA